MHSADHPANSLVLTPPTPARHAPLDEQHFRHFVDSIPVLAWMASADGYIYWYNQRWYEYTGTTPQQMEGWGWQSVHDPSVLPSVMERWTTSISTGQAFEMVFPLLGSDGAFRTFLTRIQPIKDSNGNLTHWFGTNSEIDELQRTREALQRSEAHHRRAAEDLLDARRLMELTEAETRSGFWQFTPAQQKLTMSAGARKLFGIAGENAEVAVDAAFNAIHPDDRANVQHQLEQAESTGEYSLTFRVPQPDGTDLWIGSRATVVFDPEAGPQFLGINVDITSQKLFEQKLVQSEKLAVVGRLAATISHELNNPLEAVTNLLHLMRQDQTTEDERRHYALLAEQELARVAHIVTHTLRFHRQPTRKTSEQMAPLLESAIVLHQGKINTAGILVRQRHSNTNPLLCLSGELRQVFANFIGNAVDAMAQGGDLHVRVKESIAWRQQTRGIAVLIADTGHGMDRATQDKLFEAFFSTKGDNGTGLGLWISHQIVAKHGGAIRLRSRKAVHGHGTVFRIFFPFDSPALPS